ncbi:L-rhamnose mutarotase [Streptacidiphilus sp. N1-3]|uniref:L-rhamnose mutarotase n=1 Tax=Streptacidiphilus alkalitolerans TaxID=3342712 RepID=A0ABV6X050_9ACTN
MDTEQVPPTETFTFTTLLRAGREQDYERFHRAIPAELDAAMRAAGVLGWQIMRQGTTLTHEVTARSRTRMNLILEGDEVNRAWQHEVAPFLDAGRPAPAPDAGAGALIWDFSWPTR